MFKASLVTNSFVSQSANSEEMPKSSSMHVVEAGNITPKAGNNNAVKNSHNVMDTSSILSSFRRSPMYYNDIPSPPSVIPCTVDDTEEKEAAAALLLSAGGVLSDLRRRPEEPSRKRSLSNDTGTGSESTCSDNDRNKIHKTNVSSDVHTLSPSYKTPTPRDYSREGNDDKNAKGHALTGSNGTYHTGASLNNSINTQDTSTSSTEACYVSPISNNSANEDYNNDHEAHLPTQLHHVLSKSELAGVTLEWLPHGRSWRVLRMEGLRRDVLNKHFPQCGSTCDSFFSHVSSWGFKEIKRGPDRGSFYHNLFLQGKPSLSQQIPWPASFTMRQSSSPQQRLTSQNEDIEDDTSIYHKSRNLPLPSLQVVQPDHNIDSSRSRQHPNLPMPFLNQPGLAYRSTNLQSSLNYDEKYMRATLIDGRLHVMQKHGPGHDETSNYSTNPESHNQDRLIPQLRPTQWSSVKQQQATQIRRVLDEHETNDPDPRASRNKPTCSFFKPKGTQPVVISDSPPTSHTNRQYTNQNPQYCLSSSLNYPQEETRFTNNRERHHNHAYSKIHPENVESSETRHQQHQQQQQRPSFPYRSSPVSSQMSNVTMFNGPSNNSNSSSRPSLTGLRSTRGGGRSGAKPTRNTNTELINSSTKKIVTMSKRGGMKQRTFQKSPGSSDIQSHTPSQFSHLPPFNVAMAISRKSRRQPGPSSQQRQPSQLHSSLQDSLSCRTLAPTEAQGSPRQSIMIPKEPVQ